MLDLLHHWQHVEAFFFLDFCRTDLPPSPNFLGVNIVVPMCPRCNNAICKALWSCTRTPALDLGLTATRGTLLQTRLVSRLHRSQADCSKTHQDVEYKRLADRDDAYLLSWMCQNEGEFIVYHLLATTRPTARNCCTSVRGLTVTFGTFGNFDSS